MQNVYAVQQNPTISIDGGKKNIARSVKDTNRLYLYHFYIVLRVAEYIVEYIKLQDTKHLKDNKAVVSKKLLQNPFIQYLQQDQVFLTLVEQESFYTALDDDIIKTIYKKMVQHEAYQKYIQQESSDAKDHQYIIKILLTKIIFSSELCSTHFEDMFLSWFDDRKTVQAAITHKLKAYRSSNKKFSVALVQVDWNERISFGQQLFEKSITHNQELIDLIDQQLKNWELDRITQIDMILMKMALCELLYFPHIPVKVSINEYIEIAKIYSTPKSKDFINGILDKLMRKLKSDGRIQKLGRGLVES